ncbi:MAG TPA: glycosyltransferase family 4 protein [Cryptosporangiaceae bacterium]|nr:glycosyltransferase family 4 protein [Cryptosporangiaceae bacterium]
MKVVVAHNQYSSAQPSGENAVVDAEIALLAGAGVEVVPFLRSSDEIATLPLAQKALLPLSPVYAPTAQRELRALVRRERPDVLHLHNPYPLLSPWVVRTAHAEGVPVVQTVHNFRHVCASGVYFRDGHPCHDCLGKAVPFPAVQHACYRGSRAQSAVMAATLTAHRGTWRSVQRYLALTPALAGHLRSFGITDDQIAVKPNSAPDPGEHSQVGEGLLFVGRLTEEKGLDLLLDAWRRYPEGSLGTLRIAGDGPMRDAVGVVAASRTDVRFLGRVDAAARDAAMRASAALVVPSVWDDICPMVVVEALANARPVLATDKGGLPFLVGAGEPEPAGWVVEPTVDAFAAVLPRVVAEAPSLAALARRRYLDAFTPALNTERLLAVYRQLATSQATRAGREA